MKPARHPFCCEDPYVLRQAMVGAVDEPREGENFAELKMRDLPTSVDPGVGTAGTGQPHWLLQQVRQSLFDHLLDGCGIELALPTGIGRSAVGQIESVDHDELHSKMKKGVQIRR